MTLREIRSNCGNPQSPALHTSLVNSPGLFLDFSWVTGCSSTIPLWKGCRRLANYAGVTDNACVRRRRVRSISDEEQERCRTGNDPALDGYFLNSSFGSAGCLYTQGLCASELTTAPSQVERKKAVLRQFRAAEEDGESQVYAIFSASLCSLHDVLAEVEAWTDREPRRQSAIP